jgi:hypothetical protein
MVAVKLRNLGSMELVLKSLLPIYTMDSLLDIDGLYSSVQTSVAPCSPGVEVKAALDLRRN